MEWVNGRLKDEFGGGSILQLLPRFRISMKSPLGKTEALASMHN